MAREISDVTRQIAEYTNAQNQIIFNSIAQLGLVPLSSISQHKCIVNFVLGSDTTQQNICVNYLNFTDSSSSERALAIHEAIFEEYTGILGISTERAWPLAVQKSPSLTLQEIIYRLRSNIVFVLQPPKLQTLPVPVKESSLTMDKCYKLRPTMIALSDDGMSQSRGSCLDTGRSIKSPRLLEIKTSHNFGHKEIIHVLIPRHLMELLPRQFIEVFDGKIIPIPFTEAMVSINKIPEILRILHGESIPSGSLSCDVPDYETALTRIVGSIPEFSLHAVRLHTPFDYAPRYIANLSGSAKLLRAAHAHTLKEYPNGSGWVLVHKTKMVNIPLEKRCGVSMSACLDPRVIREAIITARQPMSMSLYHQRLSLQQQRGLCCLEDTTALVIDYSNPISPIVSEPVTMLSFPEKLKVTIGNLEQLAKLGSIAEAEEREIKARAEAEARKLEAIKTIQACIRTRIAMANFETYRVAKKECEDSAKEVQLIEESLRLAQAKAEKARAKLAKAKDAIENHTIEAIVVPSTRVVAEHTATVVEHSEQVGVSLGELPRTTRRSALF